MKLSAILRSALVFVVPTLGHGQEPRPSPESAVAEFLERRGTASWQPYMIFSDCQIPGPWEEDAFRLLTTADLSQFQRATLALAWQGPFAKCNELRLNEWYFGEIEAGMRAGTPVGIYESLWRVFGSAESPELRDFLWGIALDESAPLEYRESAGSNLFVRMEGEELWREYFRIFATRQLPGYLGWFYTDKLMQIDAGRALRQMADLIREDPHRAHQSAFLQAIVSARRYGSEQDLRTFAAVLEEVLERPDLIDRQRNRLGEAVRALRRGKSPPLPPLCEIAQCR